MFRHIPSPIGAALLALAVTQACRADLGAQAETGESAVARVGAAEQGYVLEEQEAADLWHDHSSAPITFRLRGRIDTDAIAIRQSPANEAIFGDIHDAAGLRRARVGLQGELGSAGRYVAEIDLATGQVVPRDVFFGLGDATELEGLAGHFREPFSLEGSTSANTFAFLERSAINTLDPSRAWGLGLLREAPDKSYALAAGAFYSGTGPSGLEDGPGSTIDLIGRVIAAPIYEDDGRSLLHLGVALLGRWPEQGVIVVNQEPRSSLIELGDSSTSLFVPKIEIPATFQQLVNFQLAAARGSHWMQAEWYGTWIDQDAGPVVFFHGCHIDCGWFLTGEHRDYLGTGIWGPVRVHRPLFVCPHCDGRDRGWGGWELTARFAYADFFDSDTPLGPNGQLVGTELPQATFGVNWYLADRLRLMFNYTYSYPDEPTAGPSAASTFALRLNWYW